MTFRILWLGAAVAAALSACSPLAQGLIAADQDTLQVRRALDEHRANLARGYAIERIQVPEFMPMMCVVPGGGMHCRSWDYWTEERRHPINRTFEAERVALLERQLAQAEAQAERARAQCRAAHPA